MAGIGPFDSFSFPNVYTETLNEPPRPTAAGSLRFAAFIGVAEETVPVNNYEMIRGSSAMADNKIVKENVSAQFDGTNRNFTVTYYPIVKGDGSGTVTNDPATVTVLINGNSVPVASVTGATGEIYLVSIPSMGDEVLATYYFKQSDTLHTDEDVSVQAGGGNKIFQVDDYPIVDGSNAGVTTTDPTKVTVKVNNNPVTVDAVDGDTGQITLDVAPVLGDAVKVTYYSNDYQDTADILPSPYVADVTKVGYAPGTSDFVQGVNFVVDTTGSFYTINWGHSFKVASGQHFTGNEYFDSAQITPTLYDNRVFRRKATGTCDGTNKTFTLEAPAMIGNGLGKPTNDNDSVVAYYGPHPNDATAVTVGGSGVDTLTGSNTIVLHTAPPAPVPGPDGTNFVWVTEYTNLLPDEQWTLTCTVAGGTSVGKYTMKGVNTGTAMDVQWSSSDTSVGNPMTVITYPEGTSPGSRDTQVAPGYAVAETVKLNFQSATKYTVTSNVSGGTGSNGDNTGYLNQTYIDTKTGFRVTIMNSATGGYLPGDYIGYTVTPTFTTEAVPQRGAPGVKLAVTNTTGVHIGETALVNTYNKSGAEPKVGDFYYVSFDESKQFNSSGIMKAVLYTQEQDVLNATGPLTINNKVGLASHLAFLNGAPALAIQQIEKTTGGVDAPDSRYIAAIDTFNEPMEGGYRPSLLEPVTSSSAVLSYLKTSNVIQSGIRYANERMTYFGFPINTTPTAAQVIARSMLSERMIALYPDGAITTIQDQLGNDVEYLVDGSFLAAALSGRDTSPAFDVAEPITHKPVTGFRRLYRRMDSVTQAQTANAGITLIEEVGASMQVKFGLTTDLTSVLTRTPSVIRIKDFVQKGTRSVLQPYVGMKFLTQRTGEIETTLKGYLTALQTAQIITGYTGVKATPDANDPTIVRVVAYYSPVLPLLYIVVTYNLRSSI